MDYNREMKWIVMFGSLLAIAYLLFAYVFNPPREPNLQKSSSIISPTLPTIILTNGKIIEFMYQNQHLIIYAVEVPQSANISLIPNFSEKETGQTLIEKNGCEVASNGGFYQENGKALGLFVSEGLTLGKLIKSNLVNGFFWQDRSGSRFIDNNPPENSEADFILQTGPLMTVGRKISLISDEQSRRILLALDNKENLYINAVVDKENSYSGPNLADLPKIFAENDVQQQILFTTLLNLDGGAASFFYVQSGNKSFSLDELTPIGSLFCIKGI